jgi:hypothetical protein
MRPLACMIGRHEWTSRVEPGVRYKVCARCGKEPRVRRGNAAHGQQESAQSGDAGGPGTGIGGGMDVGGG